MNGTRYNILRDEMKITHSDSSSCLKFQWSRVVPCGNHGADPVVPCHRFHHAVCTVGRHIYLYGGKEGYTPLKDFWRFDTATNQWERIETRHTTLPHLQGHSMVAHKGQILIFGGTFQDSGDECPLWIYNADLNYLRHVSRDVCLDGLPMGRREHTAVLHKDVMYIYGGFLDHSGSSDEFWAFNIVQEEWSLLRKPRSGKRHGHVAVIHSNSMWIHGGMKDLNSLADLWTYSLTLQKWRQVKGNGSCPTLSYHSACVVDHTMILTGGTRQGKLSQDVWLFNFDSLTWRQVLTNAGDYLPASSLHCAVTLMNQEDSTDRTLSVPHLKKTSMVTSVSMPARPWTSPSAGDVLEDVRPEMSVGWKTDILCLEPLQSQSLDKNNNSEEDLIGAVTELETSFCSGPDSFSTYTNVTCHGERQNVLSNKEALSSSQRSPSLDCFCPSTSVTSSSGTDENLRTRPASSELSKEDLPLLKRFQSLGSDTDLGESNLAVTLSDETLFTPNKQIPEIAEVDSNCSGENYVPKENEDSLYSYISYLPKNIFSENTTQNPASDVKSSESHIDANETPLLNGEALPQVIKKTEHHQADNCDNPKKRSRSICANDIIVEDLEFSDVTSLFQNVAIEYPSNAAQKWSSLKNLKHVSSKSLENSETNLLQTLNMNGTRTVSCSNLYAKSQLHKENKCYSETMLVEKENMKNSLSDLHCFSESIERLNKVKAKASEVSNRFIKNVGPTGGRTVPNVVKKKIISAQREPTAKLNQSVGTQTGSLMSLTKSGTTSENAKSSSRTDLTMNKSTNSSNCYQRQPLDMTTSQSSQHSSQCSGNKLMGTSQAIMVILGGQSENPSFQRESLKVWKCHLY